MLAELVPDETTDECEYLLLSDSGARAKAERMGAAAYPDMPPSYGVGDAAYEA